MKTVCVSPESKVRGGNTVPPSSGLFLTVYVCTVLEVRGGNTTYYAPFYRMCEHRAQGEGG